MYKYSELNSDVSKDVKNLVIKFTSKTITQTLLLIIIMIIITFYLKRLILKLNKVSFSESSCRINNSLIIYYCLKSKVLLNKLYVNLLMYRNFKNVKQNDTCYVVS